MTPQFIAMAVSMFYRLTSLEQKVMIDSFNQSMLSLGMDWWEINMDAVVDELISRYQQRNAAEAVVGFCSFYSSLF